MQVQREVAQNYTHKKSTTKLLKQVDFIGLEQEIKTSG